MTDPDTKYYIQARALKPAAQQSLEALLDMRDKHGVEDEKVDSAIDELQRALAACSR